jgi:hypothetical protein
VSRWILESESKGFSQLGFQHPFGEELYPGQWNCTATLVGQNINVSETFTFRVTANSMSVLMPPPGGSSTERRSQLKNMLGAALEKGSRIYNQNDKTTAEAWVTETHDLIAKEFGKGEAALFLSDAGYTFYSGPGKVGNWVTGRRQRLGELIGRVDTIAV